MTAIDHMRELEKNSLKDMDYLAKRYAHGIESLYRGDSSWLPMPCLAGQQNCNESCGITFISR